jgi:hypothetical protein
MEVKLQVVPKRELIDPIVTVKSKTIPLKITDKPEGVIQKQSLAREKLVTELKKLQTSTRALRSQYSSDALPEWVGELVGDVDYREFLRSKGVEVPAVDDSGSMEDTADGHTVDDSSMEDKANEEDIAEGIPVHGSTIGDVDPEQSAPVDISQYLPAPASSNQQEAPADRVAVDNLQVPADKESARKTKLPAPTINVKSKAIPLKIVEKPEGVIQKPSSG